MSEYGTLTIRFEFCKKREGISTWHKTATLATMRGLLLEDAEKFAQEFKAANSQIADMLHICWQADPVFIR